MKQRIAHIALVVRDYDEAIEFYTKKLDFYGSYSKSVSARNCCCVIAWLKYRY